jgi:GT2 family glycosyltransferase
MESVSPSVSVVIATYNYGQYLAEALNSQGREEALI